VTVDLKAMAARVADGDASAYRHIVSGTQAPLFRLAARLMGDLAEAEDALQEGYVKAYRALCAGQYDGRAKLLTWMYRIVYRTCLDAKRKRREFPTAEQPEPKFDGNVTAEARLALQQLDGWLAELPEQQRSAIVMSVMEGMSNTEIAEVMECSEGAVQQRLVRARAALREKRDRQEATDHE
jgi:RNA polymerase sigma-70 factor (ECF subfamily)